MRIFLLGPNMSQAKSGVIWNYAEMILIKSEKKRWRKISWVRTRIMPNLLSKIFPFTEKVTIHIDRQTERDTDTIVTR